MEQPITIDELQCALNKLPNGKTPGCDGLTAEFSKKFWDRIKTPLYNAMLYAYKQKQLPLSSRRGIITLTPKKNRDILYIKNWRPLTMLNVDYKILSKALACRLKLFLPRLISN